jgi:hypothetical protein
VTKILFIGDVVGRPGRDAVARWLPSIVNAYQVDLVIANGENAAGGLGATRQVLDELFAEGVHGITLGNHTWRKREFAQSIDAMHNVARPANYPPGQPGRGAFILETPGGHKVAVVSLLGRVFMDAVDCPFRTAVHQIEALRAETPLILVDIHAEATSEKVALGWYLDGRCTAVVGTHTHVQTADERVLPEGTAYITDVGMTGPFDSCIGVEYERVITRFVTGMPTEFRTAKRRPGISAVLITADPETGKAHAIERIVRAEEA